MDSFFGIIGLVGFEASRLYKKHGTKMNFNIKDVSKFYIVIITLLALFSGACAHALANGNLASALFIGYSVPTGIKNILSPSSGSVSGSSVEIDDIEIKVAEPASFREIFLDYFK